MEEEIVNEVVAEEVVVATPEVAPVEAVLVCNCENGDNISIFKLNDHEGIQECSKCLRFSKFPL